MRSVGTSTRVIVQTASMKDKNNNKIDPSHIYILGLWSTGNTPIKIKSIYLTNKSDYSEESTGIEEPDIIEGEETPLLYKDVRFDLFGRRINIVSKGQLYIRNGKKYIAN